MNRNNPTVKYGTTAYSLLCYAKSARKQFSVEDVKYCLAGALYGKSEKRIREMMATLARKGLVSEIGDKWEITPDGKEMIFFAASYYRSEKERLLGKRYVASVSEKVTSTGLINPSLDLESEELALIELEDKFKKAEKRDKKKTSSRPQAKR